jgi:hypothetical protein
MSFSVRRVVNYPGFVPMWLRGLAGSLVVRRQHPPGTITHNLIEHRPTRRAISCGRVVDYRKQGRTFPNQRANAGS